MHSRRRPPGLGRDLAGRRRDPLLTWRDRDGTDSGHAQRQLPDGSPVTTASAVGDEEPQDTINKKGTKDQHQSKIKQSRSTTQDQDKRTKINKPRSNTAHTCIAAAGLLPGSSLGRLRGPGRRNQCHRAGSARTTRWGDLGGNRRGNSRGYRNRQCAVRPGRDGGCDDGRRAAATARVAHRARRRPGAWRRSHCRLPAGASRRVADTSASSRRPDPHPADSPAGAVGVTHT